MLSLQTRVRVQHGCIPMFSVSPFAVKTKLLERFCTTSLDRQLAICTDCVCKIVVNYRPQTKLLEGNFPLSSLFCVLRGIGIDVNKNMQRCS